jgi:hypothetical protein
MKRVSELQALSQDHHHALVLARKAKKAGSGEDGFSTRDMWADIEARFKTELEPHFQIEESLIASNLETQGEFQLVKRLYEEHEALRQFLIPGSGRTSADLQSFGELLEKHIRFEERELFEAAQNSLSPDELRAVARACHTRPSG